MNMGVQRLHYSAQRISQSNQGEGGRKEPSVFYYRFDRTLLALGGYGDSSLLCLGEPEEDVREVET